MFFLENLPKNLVRISNETAPVKPKESQLNRFRYLINKSNNKTKLTMKIATDTSEMINDTKDIFSRTSKLLASKNINPLEWQKEIRSEWD